MTRKAMALRDEGAKFRGIAGRGADVLRALGISDRGNLTSFWTLFWILVCLHQLFYGWIMVKSSFVPYVLDGNETFSVWWHAHNLYTFSFWKSFGLTDESYGLTEAAHPFIHTHQGNMPRLFGFLIYALGARNVESQVLVTTLIIGNLTLYFCYALIARLTRPTVAFVFCIFLFSDYLLFAQWHLVTYRIWYGFLFFGVLFAIANADRRNGVWPYVLLAALFFLLFYFELVFAVYISVICAFFAIWRHWRQPKKIAVIYVVQLVGGVAAIATLFFQLTAALGYDVVIKDFSSTFIARNASSATTGDRALVQFFQDNNIVFWQNFRDGASLRMLTAFARSLGTAVFQIWTPAFFVLVMAPFIGVATSFMEIRHHNAKSDRLSHLIGGLIPSSKTVFQRRGMGFAVLYAIRSYAGLLAFGLTLGLVVFEMIQPGNLFGLALSNFDTPVVCSILVITSVLILVLGFAHLTASRGVRFVGRCALKAVMLLAVVGPAFIIFRSSLSIEAVFGLLTASGWMTSFLLAIALLLSMAGSTISCFFFPLALPAMRGILASLVLALLFAVNPSLFNQNYNDVWLPLFDDPMVRIGIRIAVAVASATGIAIAVYGARRSFGPFWRASIGRALLLLLVCFVGYAIIYVLSPGYVLSGYVERLAPFAIYFLAGIPAITVSAVALVGYRLWTTFREQDNSLAWSFGCVFVPISAILVLSTTLSLWLRVQTYYMAALPPDFLAFAKTFSSPPFKDASFAVNNYAAVVAYYSRGWATIDMALAKPAVDESNFKPARQTDRSYLWFADWSANPEYQATQYYACMKMPTLDSVLAVRDPKKFGNRYNFCGNEAILKAGSPFDDRLLASDAKPPKFWSIVALGALRPQIASVTNSVTRGDNHWVVAPHLEMRSPESSSSISKEYDLLIAPDALSCDVHDNEFKLLQSTMDDKPLELPAGFLGAFRVRARAALGSAVGDWKDSKTWIVNPMTARGEGSNIRCLTIVASIPFDASSPSIRAIGWSDPEPWGTWSNGRVATLNPIAIPTTSDDSDLLLRVNARAFFAGATPSQRVTVSANGSVVANWEFTETEPPREMTATIPKALFKAKSSVTLSFKIEKPTSPASAGMSVDKRELGFGVLRLTLEELQ